MPRSASKRNLVVVESHSKVGFLIVVHFNKPCRHLYISQVFKKNNVIVLGYGLCEWEIMGTINAELNQQCV